MSPRSGGMRMQRRCPPPLPVPRVLQVLHWAVAPFPKSHFRRVCQVLRGNTQPKEKSNGRIIGRESGTKRTYHEHDPPPELPGRHSLSTKKLHLSRHQHVAPTLDHDLDQLVLVCEGHVTFEADEDWPVPFILFIPNVLDGLPDRRTHIHKGHALAECPPMRHDWHSLPGSTIPPHVDFDAPCRSWCKKDVLVGSGGGTAEQLPTKKVGVV